VKNRNGQDYVYAPIGKKPGEVSDRFLSQDGRGPATVFAHSACGSIAETAAIGKHVTGRRIHFHFPGYGASPRPRPPLTLHRLACCLEHMPTARAATQAVSISLGTSALLHLLARRPHALRRAVLVLPFTLDRLAPPSVREHYDACLAAGRAGDAHGMLELLRTSPPDDLHRSPALIRHARSLVEQGIPELLGGVSGFVPVPDARALTRVTAESLIITHRDDPFHCVDVAENLAAAIPGARLHTVGHRGALSTHHAEVTELIGEFLNRPT
jgi:pimeloyl-ACP methyl ester carboxylesterase